MQIAKGRTIVGLDTGDAECQIFKDMMKDEYGMQRCLRSFVITGKLKLTMRNIKRHKSYGLIWKR